MTQIVWDAVGKRFYETGVDHGVLYLRNGQGVYNAGYAWNGLTAVTSSPTGAETTKLYADNLPYLTLLSVEEYEATIEAYTYPDEFAECDGSAVPTAGVSIGQQPRKPFGFSWRTRKGNDIDGADHGYKIHLVYEALAAPTEKAYNTINESPEAATLSWEVTTTPVEVPGHKPSAHIEIDSTQVNASRLAQLEQILYGTPGQDPRLPLPTEVLSILGGAVVEVVAVRPAFADDTITIPTVTGVEYLIAGEVVTGTVDITEDTFVNARATSGYKLSPLSDDDWVYEYSG